MPGYRCVVCDGTWNRPIVERRAVSALDRKVLLSLQANDPDLVRSLPFDIAGLKRWTWHVREFNDVAVVKRVFSESRRPASLLEIECRVPQPIGLRADRLLASELQLSRSSIRRLAILTAPLGVEPRRPLRDGTRFIIGTGPSREQHQRSVGSRRSRSQSPTIEIDRVDSTITAAGDSMIHGARVRYSRP